MSSVVCAAVAMPVLRAIPGGTFAMGESDGDKFANDTERPRHLVTVAPFHLADFPVTVGEFRRLFPDHAPLDVAELPATSVTWTQAVKYCEWLAAETGAPFRLPSEAEWEYACRAGAMTPFSCGLDLPPDRANYLYSEHGERIGPAQRTPRGTFPPNPWGLEDMHGNVCEWCADLWHPAYHSAPVDASAWTVDGTHGRRVVRGGAWDYLPRLLRSSWRDALPENARRDNVGFRIACSIS